MGNLNLKTRDGLTKTTIDGVDRILQINNGLDTSKIPNQEEILLHPSQLRGNGSIVDDCATRYGGQQRTHAEGNNVPLRFDGINVCAKISKPKINEIKTLTPHIVLTANAQGHQREDDGEDSHNVRRMNLKPS